MSHSEFLKRTIFIPGETVGADLSCTAPIYRPWFSSTNFPNAPLREGICLRRINMVIRSINPATEEVLAEFEEFTPEQVDTVLREAQQAFGQWHRTSFEERAALMRSAASFLRQHKERLAGLITAEMGKPIVEAEAEIEKCAWTGEFYAEQAARFLAGEPV